MIDNIRRFLMIHAMKKLGWHEGMSMACFLLNGEARSHVEFCEKLDFEVKIMKASDKETR